MNLVDESYDGSNDWGYVITVPIKLCRIFWHIHYKPLQSLANATLPLHTAVLLFHLVASATNVKVECRTMIFVIRDQYMSWTLVARSAPVDVAPAPCISDIIVG
jgi:hypothetical protein